uniref:Leucine-rich immune protein (Short) n=1 Tax=Anopheles christyi TaxID=43041 RepID=A0A182JWD0_9DIPT
MMTPTRLLALFILSAFIPTSYAVTTYRCDDDVPFIKATCLMQNVTLATPEDVGNASFSIEMRYVALKMMNGFIAEFTRPLAAHFSQVQDLAVDAMGIRKLYIWSNLEQLSARNNSIRLVDFAPAGVQNRLRSLRLDNNELSTVPSFGRSFNELTYLSLEGNRLEQVALDAFAGLAQLQSLSLARNGLIVVEPATRAPNRPIDQGVQLLKLKHLSLASNRLITVNISGWEMPSLVSFDVSNNDLYLLLDEPQHIGKFGALLDFSYSGNDWKCGWLSEAQLVLRTRGITTIDQDPVARCDREKMKALNGICCYERAFEQELTEKDPFESRWEQLNELRRRYELVQFSYDQVQDADLNLITERVHDLRGQLMGPVAQDQDEANRELVQLRHALDEEKVHLERLELRIERAVLELGQSIDEMHERAVRPKPTLDAVRQQTIEDSIERIRGNIESLRRKVQNYVYETSERDKRIRRYGERIEYLEDQIAEGKLLEYSLNERAEILGSRVAEAYRVIEDFISRNSEEVYNRIRAPRISDYTYQMRRG